MRILILLIALLSGCATPTYFTRTEYLHSQFGDSAAASYSQTSVGVKLGPFEMLEGVHYDSLEGEIAPMIGVGASSDIGHINIKGIRRRSGDFETILYCSTEFEF